MVCSETVTWKGLPLRDGRLVPYERVDARAASTLFVREAMLGEALDGFGPLAANRAALAQARSVGELMRDPALAIDEGALESWYRARLGLERDDAPVIASSDALRRFIAGHPPGNPCA